MAGERATRHAGRMDGPPVKRAFNVTEPSGSGSPKGDVMQKKCEDCGVWADEEYILNMDGVELCVLCALKLEESGDAREVGGIAE